MDFMSVWLPTYTEVTASALAVNETGFYQLENTIFNTDFFGLNTQACFAKNTGLIEAFGDPGQQLYYLEQALSDARDNSRGIIIAGNVSPGHPLCNR